MRHDMRIAQVKDGTVVNIIVADETYPLSDGEFQSEFANIGDKHDGKSFVAPASKKITEKQALNFARGVCNSKIDHAYSHDGFVRRQSLYGYFAYLNNLSSIGKISADQKADLATLVAAAEWEESMVSAMNDIAELRDTSKIVLAKWPELEKTIAKKLSALAAVS